MKKLFTLFAAMMAAVAMFATDPVVIDFTQNPNNLTANNQSPDITVTVDGVTAHLTQASSTSVPMLTPSHMRVYKSAQVEFTSTIGNIKAITFVTDGASYGIDGFGTPSTGTLTGDVWTGDAATVAFPATNHQVRLASVTIHFDEGYTPPVVTVDTIGVSEAKARIDAGNLGKCYVYGRVVEIDASKIAQYSNLNCWFVDLVNPLDTMEGYKMNGANNAAYTNEDAVEYIVGDTVLFYASALKKYNTTYEINEGYYVETLGGSEQADKIKVDFDSAYVVADYTYDVISFNLYGANNTSLVIENWGRSDAYTDQTMAGTYAKSNDNPDFTLTVNGTVVTLVSGSLSVEYVSTNNDGKNQYKFKLNATSADKRYYSESTIWATVVGTDGVSRPMINDNNHIMASLAAQEASKLASGATGDITYNIYGYVSKMGKQTDKGGQVFYIADNAGSNAQTFYCYGITMPTAPAVGDLVKVVAKLKNYKGTIETDFGNGEIITALPPYVRYGDAPINVTVAKALEIGADLEDNAVTEKIYRVHGYAQKIVQSYNAQYNNQSFYMNDTLNPVAKSDFYAYHANTPSATDTVCTGAYVAVIGRIKKYVGDKGYATIQIENGTVEIIHGTPIENVWATEQKAVKTIEKGMIIIRRNEENYLIDGRKF